MEEKREKDFMITRIRTRRKNQGRRMAQSKEKIFILGESPLVEEFATLCADKGYIVLAKLTSRKFQLPKHRDIKKTTSIPRTVSFAFELTNINSTAKRKAIAALDKALPPSIPILTSSLTVTATEQSAWIKHPERLIGICAFPTLVNNKLVEVAPTIHSSKEALNKTKNFLWNLGKEISVVQDRVGMVLPRILCMLINEAAFALMERIASPEDIDTAMKFGTNYPLGPIEWADKIGINHVYALVKALHDDLQEDRYRYAPLLKQMAVSGEWWKRG